jgi:hypothetical protein
LNGDTRHWSSGNKVNNKIARNKRVEEIVKIYIRKDICKKIKSKTFCSNIFGGKIFQKNK